MVKSYGFSAVLNDLVRSRVVPLYPQKATKDLFFLTIPRWYGEEPDK